MLLIGISISRLLLHGFSSYATREAKVEWFIDPFSPEKCKTGKLFHEAGKMEESTFNFIFESAVFKKRPPEDALF